MRTLRNRSALATYQRDHHGPNMTPMVDVTMVILIFFMVSTVVLAPELLLSPRLLDRDRSAQRDTGPGTGRAALTLAPPSFAIDLRVAEGRVIFDGLGIEGGELDRLRAAATQLASELRGPAATGDTDEEDAGIDLIAAISARDDVPYDAIIFVQDELERAGFTDVGLR